MTTTPKKKARPKQFNIRLSKTEWSQCSSIADYYGLNTASLIRMLLKREERQIENEKSPGYTDNIESGPVFGTMRGGPAERD